VRRPILLELRPQVTLHVVDIIPLAEKSPWVWGQKEPFRGSRQRVGWARLGHENLAVRKVAPPRSLIPSTPLLSEKGGSLTIANFKALDTIAPWKGEKVSSIHSWFHGDPDGWAMAFGVGKTPTGRKRQLRERRDSRREWLP